MRALTSIVVVALLASSASAASAGRVARGARRLAVAATAVAALGVTQAVVADAAAAAPTPKPLKTAVKKERGVAPGADPSILTVGGTHYLVSTESGQVRTSTDLVHWSNTGPIFPGGKLPKGAKSGFWAPSLSTDGSRFFLRYSARDKHGIHRVRSAVADTVTGPYTDLGPTVPKSRVGDIDPSEFIDTDGTRWLMWKRAGTATGQPTPMFIQELTADGTTLEGKRFTLTTNNAGWEGASTEAPSAIRHGQTVYVSYAGGIWDAPGYNVGALRIKAPDGLAQALAHGKRFQKHRGPIADSTSPKHQGMGHGDFILGGDFFVSHGWKGGAGTGDREVVIRRVSWAGGWPHIKNAR